MNIPGFKTEDRALIAEPGLTREQYADASKFLASLDTIARSQMPWWVGDLVNIGEDRFGDDAYQMLEFDDICQRHLALRSLLARKVNPETRRMTSRWEMARLASIKIKDQEKMAESLREAEAEGLTAREYKAKLNGRPNYRSPRPERTPGRTKKYDRLMADFDNHFDRHSSNWLASPSNREMARKIYKHALEVAGL